MHSVYVLYYTLSPTLWAPLSSGRDLSNSNSNNTSIRIVDNSVKKKCIYKYTYLIVIIHQFEL